MMRRSVRRQGKGNSRWGLLLTATSLVVIATGLFAMRGFAATPGTINTIAGDGIAGYSGDGGLATSAELDDPNAAAFDAHGNMYVADLQGNRVRVVAGGSGTYFGQTMTAGDIYTVAGDGIQGYNGGGIAATSAELYWPYDVALDHNGNLVVADTYNHRIRVVAATSGTYYGISMTADDIYTVAGTGTAGYNGDGRAATSAELNYPETVVFDGHGNLVVADTDNSRIRVVAATSGTYYGVSMTAHDIYTVAGAGVWSYNGDGIAATSADLYTPQSVAIDAYGNVVVSDTANDRIRVVAATSGTNYGVSMTAGDIYTVAGTGTAGYSGDGGPASSAEIHDTYGVAVDAIGNLIISDAWNYRIRVVAATSGTNYGVSMTAGDIYTVAGTGTAGYSGDSGPATLAAINEPWEVTIDPAGDLVFGDPGNHRIREVSGGQVVTFDPNGGSGSMAPEADNAPTALTANVFTRAGYTFTGWNIAPDGSSTAYADGATYPFTVSATLYAQWTANTYAVTFDPNGGSGSMAPEADNAPTALTANVFTRAGYTFTGWNIASDGSSTAYADGATYPFTVSATLYAQWTGVAPVITSANATTFEEGSPGTFSVSATGTPSPVLTETGALPPGVLLSSAGVLAGTPSAAGTFPFTITASNGVSPDATQHFTLTVAPLGFHITTTSISPNSAKIGTAYQSSPLNATAGTTPYKWKVTAGALPKGLKLRKSTGLISGTVKLTKHSPAPGVYSFTVTVTDHTKHVHKTATAHFSIILTS
jgi:uncharacterized repeat protein (TIGR02543 family)